jgi:hypothetical protein
MQEQFDFEYFGWYLYSQTMKKRCARLLIVPAIFLGLWSPSSAADRHQGTIELFLGHYEIKDSRFKDVYQTGGPIQGLALSSALAYGLEFYSEIKAFYKVGALTYTKEETKLLLLPFALGLRYAPSWAHLIPYAGAGVDVYFSYETNPIAKTLNVSKGTHILAGLYLQFGKSLPIRLSGKVKYTWVTATENEIVLELGGLEYGGGIAFVF